jgi:hypothetical protein
MMIKMNGALGRCLGGSALGAFIAIAFIPPATAQWMSPWGAPFPGYIERSLEAHGYVLTAPLMRRPGVYLADVSAGPAGHQRLIIDARSGQVLERFPAPGRGWGPALAARDEELDEPQPGAVGPPLNRGFSGPAAPVARMTNAGPGNVHIPAAVSAYGAGAPRAGTKVKPKSASMERKAAIINPPLPPPAPRETAKADGSGSAAPQLTENPDSGQPRINSASTEAGNGPSASAPATQGLPTEASDKPKVSIIPPGLFQ